MAKEATMSKSAQDIRWERIRERDNKAAQLCSDILIGCDMSKITKKQITEIDLFIKRRLEWAVWERNGATKYESNGGYTFAESVAQLKNVELAARALKEWTIYKSRTAAMMGRDAEHRVA
jgi:hypothetical protein